MIVPQNTKFGPVFKLNQPDDNYKYRPLPAPTGNYPYRISYPAQHNGKMVFHLVGDTGGFRDQNFQHLLAAEMAAQYQTEKANSHQPEFLYHLGDVVYNHGEATAYAKQFFQPYEAYPGPVYAIAGNHDSDVNPDSETPYPSLDAFVSVFCDTEPNVIKFGGATKRRSNTQPHVYWTMECPLVTIIGMHSNVPKYGIVTNEQRNWLIEELKHADSQRPNKAIIIAIHHAPYSADTNHGASLPMIELLEGVFAETGIRPDLVVSGHVHNYQRFQKHYPDGKPITYLVAGAGGYDELHSLAAADDPRFSGDSPIFDNIELQAYNDTDHGFLKLCIQEDINGLSLTGEYYLVDKTPALSGFLADRFTIKLA